MVWELVREHNTQFQRLVPEGAQTTSHVTPVVKISNIWGSVALKSSKVRDKLPMSLMCWYLATLATRVTITGYPRKQQ